MSRLVVEGATLLGLADRKDIRPSTNLYAEGGTIRATACRAAGRTGREAGRSREVGDSRLRAGPPPSLPDAPAQRTRGSGADAVVEDARLAGGSRPRRGDDGGLRAPWPFRVPRGGGDSHPGHGHRPPFRRALRRRGARRYALRGRQRAHGRSGDGPVKPARLRAAEYAADKSLLIHRRASENRGEVDFVRRRTGLGNVAYLERTGLLTERTCLAHAVHTDAADWDVLGARGTSVAHCPTSN